jgi:hypothetical protein
MNTNMSSFTYLEWPLIFTLLHISDVHFICWRSSHRASRARDDHSLTCDLAHAFFLLLRTKKSIRTFLTLTFGSSSYIISIPNLLYKLDKRMILYSSKTSASYLRMLRSVAIVLSFFTSRS